MRGERKSSKPSAPRLSTVNGITMTPLCVDPRSEWSADETTTSLCGPFARLRGVDRDGAAEGAGLIELDLPAVRQHVVERRIDRHQRVRDRRTRAGARQRLDLRAPRSRQGRRRDWRPHTGVLVAEAVGARQAVPAARLADVRREVVRVDRGLAVTDVRQPPVRREEVIPVRRAHRRADPELRQAVNGQAGRRRVEMVGERAVAGRAGEARVGRGQQLHAISVVERLDVDLMEPARVVVELHLDVERHRGADVLQIREARPDVDMAEVRPGGTGCLAPPGLGLEEDARLAVDGAVGVCSRSRPGAGHDRDEGKDDQQERAPHAVTIHSRIRRWDSPPLTTSPLGSWRRRYAQTPTRSTASLAGAPRSRRLWRAASRAPALNPCADGLPFAGARDAQNAGAIPGPWAAGSGGQLPVGPCAPLRELPPTSATRRGARGREQSPRPRVVARSRYWLLLPIPRRARLRRAYRGRGTGDRRTSG